MSVRWTTESDASIVTYDATPKLYAARQRFSNAQKERSIQPKKFVHIIRSNMLCKLIKCGWDIYGTFRSFFHLIVIYFECIKIEQCRMHAQHKKHHTENSRIKKNILLRFSPGLFCWCFEFHIPLTKCAHTHTHTDTAPMWAFVHIILMHSIGCFNFAVWARSVHIPIVLYLFNNKWMLPSFCLRGRCRCKTYFVRNWISASIFQCGKHAHYFHDGTS